MAQQQNASPMKTMASLEIKLPVPKDSQTSSTSTLPIEGSRQKSSPTSSPVHFDQDSMEDDQEDEDDWDAFQSFPVSTDAAGTVLKAESAAEKPNLVEKSISEREFQDLPTSKSVNNESDMSNAELQEVISNDLGHDIKSKSYEAPSDKYGEGAVSSQENIETVCYHQL